MLTPMRFRCPDKPTRISQEKLKELRDGDYIATIKYDGWRCIIDWDGEKVEFYSRRGAAQGGPTTLPINCIIGNEALEFLKENQIPPNTRLDAEWVGRRSSGGEQIILLGVQYYNTQWLGSEPERVRWELLKVFKYRPSVILAGHTTSNYVAFFEDAKAKDMAKPDKLWESEGIVLKHQNSKLVGNPKESAKNPMWFKAKWRDGPDGKGSSF